MKLIDLEIQQLRIRKQIDARIDGVLRHGQYINGPEVAEFEEGTAKFWQARHSIACANGTDALQLALMSLKIKPGHIVFCPSFTFAATAEAIVLAGAIPYFVDVSPESYNVCLDSLERSIEAARKKGYHTAGIISVDMFGRPAEYESIAAIAAKEGLWTISDSAQSFGATSNERSPASFFDLVTTSFFPAKPLGCYGDGGALFTDNEKLSDALRSLRAHGAGSHKYENAQVGMNSRLDTIQAAILLEKLAIFPKEIEMRQDVAESYRRQLKQYFLVPVVPTHDQSVWAQYTLCCTEEQTRAKVLGHLSANEIPHAIYYPKPCHLQSAYSQFPVDPEGLRNSIALSDRVFSVPMHPYLTEIEQDRVISVLIESAVR